VRPLIIEGPDGAGKSTLLARLSNGLDRPVFHTGGSNKDREELDRKCREQADLMLQGVILDRCTFISDPLYKEALGQPLLLSPTILRARLWTLNPIIIFCCRGSSDDMLTHILDVVKAHKPPEYLEQVKVNHPKIVAGYHREMDRLSQEGFTILRYDWKIDDYPTFEWKVLTRCAA
jgi:hypothetical protein